MPRRFSRKTSWPGFVSQHASIFFLGVVLILGTFLGFWGYKLIGQPGGTTQPLAIIVLQLAGTLIAVALTCLFFNLPDLRNYLASTIATLFSRGDVVPILSAPTKAVLRERLALDLLGQGIQGIEPTLFEHLQAVSSTALSSPYVTNFDCTISIEQLEKDDHSILVNNTLMSYTLHMQHLSTGGARIPLRVFREHSFPKESVPSYEEWLREFRVEIGKQIFGRDSVKFETEPLGSKTLLRAIFHLDIDPSHDVDISILVRFLYLTEDPVDIIYARYPSQGFHATLTFDNQRSYDCGWFTHCDPSVDGPSRGRIDVMHNGISARTSEWVLPGEGVALYYYKTS